MDKRPISVILIEDDPMVQEVNKQFVERVPGFRIVGTASNGREGLDQIRSLQPDLVIMDIYMPELNGLETLKQIRQQQLEVDVIAITAANDRKSIREMLHNGAADYIMKPFKFERVRQSLEDYRELRTSLQREQSLSQSELDRLLRGRSETGPRDETELPKGLQELTLKQIIQFLMGQTAPLSAEEVAEGVGLARVTARRYLDYLEKKRQVQLDMQYGGVGRPINRYKYIQ